MERREARRRGWELVLLGLAAALYGLMLSFSATRYDPALHGLVGKQAAALGAGAGLCLLLPLVDLRALLRRFWPVLAGLNVGALLLLIPLGNEDGTGNKSWIALPGGFNVQPAEFIKLSFVLLLAWQLTRQKEHGLDRPRSVLLLAGHVLILCGLLYGVSGDMGMTVVYLAIYFGMIWAAGLHPLWILAQLGAGLGGMVLLWGHLPDYVRLRLLVVLDHDLDPLGKGFQQGRSILALGSGQVTGQGYLRGIQTQSASPAALPARHTDFIFSVAGEELGLVGCLILLALLMAIIWRCLHLAQGKTDPLLSYAAVGIAGMFGVQMVLNVGMCLYAAPVIGVTLPFFSYGGSSLLSAFAGIGILRSLAQSAP